MTGKTVEDAVEAACAALALSRDEVSVEVIDMPQKRLFGSTPAKVRVYVTEDSFSVKDLLRSREEKVEEKPVKQDTGNKRETEKPKETETRQESKRTEAPDKTVAPAPQAAAPKAPEKEIPFEELPNPAQAAFSYLKDVAEKMKAENLTFRAIEFDGGVKFVVDGDDAAILIGRRGETMDALQYLSLLVSNRAEGEYVKISLDVANYRSKREQTLESLAKRVAGKVQKTRRSQTLEPMNPYERRIVHSAVQEIEGVKSESVGEDPHRRVVILMEGDTPRPYNNNRGGRDRNNNNNRSSGGRRNDSYNRDRDRDRAPRREEAPKLTEKPPEPRPQDPELEKNLYGKIEL